MNCQQIQQLLPLYHHKELPQTTLQQIQQHLNHCQICQNTYLQQIQLLQQLQTILTPTPSPHYQQKLYQKWRKLYLHPQHPQPIPPKSFLTKKNTAIATAAIALLTLTLSLTTKLPSLTPTSPTPNHQPTSNNKNKPKLEYQQLLTLLDPDDPQANITLVQWCLRHKFFPQAKQHLQQILTQCPSHPQAHQLLQQIPPL